jgi:CHAT domain-containing protein
LKYYTSELQPGELEDYAATMLRQLVFVDYDVLDTAERIYHLLFPDGLINDLAQSAPDTLVFIPDGPVRSIPIAALFDGESYLIEKYSVAITPGLQLLNPQPLQEKSLTALTFGLTEAVAEWSPLPNVAKKSKRSKSKFRLRPISTMSSPTNAFRKRCKVRRCPLCI